MGATAIGDGATAAGDGGTAAGDGGTAAAAVDPAAAEPARDCSGSAQIAYAPASVRKPTITNAGTSRPSDPDTAATNSHRPRPTSNAVNAAPISEITARRHLVVCWAR